MHLRGRVAGARGRKRAGTTERHEDTAEVKEKGFARWERLTSTRDNCRDTQNAEPLEPIFRTWKEKERKLGEEEGG